MVPESEAMTHAHATSCFPAPQDLGLRARLYRAIAQEVAGLPRGGAVLVEASTTLARPIVTVRPSSVAEAVLTSPTLRRGVEANSGSGAIGAPPTGQRSAQVDLVAVRPSSTAPSGADAGDRPEPRALLAPGERLDAQTFWLSGRGDGRLWVARRIRFSSTPGEALGLRFEAISSALAGDWSRATGTVVRPVRRRWPGADWARGASRGLRRDAWLPLSPAAADRLAEPSGFGSVPQDDEDDGHALALGASGAGKTTHLAGLAARTIRRGGTVLALDLHGDLAPAILGRLLPAERARLVAVDISARPVVGIAALAGSGDRAAAQLVAAVKRLSPDGTELYWGFRLERIFDAFVRLVQESGGTLVDVYALLTDADRREAARLATRTPELARFLDELGPIVRRTPEFLWPAAARLAKVVLVPELAELLAPRDGGLPVEELLDAGRSVLVRLPFSSVGPEAASFAGSLVLARCYLGLAGRRGPTGRPAPVLVVLDEVQGLSPRLVAEMLTEGRKFGLRLALASQYPERLAPELRHAAAGVSRDVVAFRAPRASAAEVGAWLGLGPLDAQRLLPELPAGLGLRRARGGGALEVVPTEGPGIEAADAVWHRAVGRTGEEFPTTPTPGDASVGEVDERLLLAVLAGEELGCPVPVDRIVQAALQLPGPAIDPAVAGDRTTGIERERLAERRSDGWRLTPAGERRLGLRATTGASRESVEHRALLLRSFRIFARHGHRLEIVRQGRFDTTLPDARLRQLSDRERGLTPRELADAMESARRSWAWRFFGGRDVHVEAEVSGALRPARIRHGLRKAAGRGAFALFVVGDAARASRVRRTLRAEGVGIDRAQVWTLREGAARSEPTEGKSPQGVGRP